LEIKFGFFYATRTILITKEINHVSFSLELSSAMEIHLDFHLSLLKSYYRNTISKRVLPPPPPMKVYNDLEYKIDSKVEEVLKFSNELNDTF